MNLKVTLNWAYIKNEIDYETYKAAEITITDDPIVKGEAQSDNTNADADFCRAKIDTAVATIEEIMHKHYLTTSLEEADNVLSRNRQNWVLNLIYSDSERRLINLESLTAHCHRYIVDYVLAEWCKLALPKLTDGYLVRMQSEERSIGLLINRKEAPTLFDEDQDDDIDTTVQGFSAKITEVTTVASGSDAEVDVVVEKTTAPDGSVVPTLNFSFKLPQGSKGDTGQKGDTGARGLQGIQGVPGTVDYDTVYAHCDALITTKSSSTKTSLIEFIESKSEQMDAQYTSFTSRTNTAISTQNQKINAVTILAENIKSFINYDTNNPKYITLDNMIKQICNGIIDTERGGFGTQVAWSTQNGAYIGLNVAGTTKNLLMQGFLENIFIPVDADGNEVGYAANNIYAIKFRHNLFSMGGVTAYGMGSDAESSGGVSNFGDLADVRTATGIGNGKVWGYLNGAYTWLDQSEGKTYTGDGTYISISGTKISFIGSGQFLASGTTTSGIAEGTNLYFTAARAQDALSGHTGDTDIHLQSGERTKWTEAYNKRHEHSNKATLDLIGTDTLTLWGNTVKLNTTNNNADGAITIKNGDKSVTISVDTDGNLKIDNTAGNANLYATGGVSAYGLGLDSLTPVTAFSQLSDISGGTAGQVWGKTQNGFGWVDQSVGAIYSGDGTYISVSGTTISLSSALKTDLSTIRSNALLGSYAYAWGDHSSAGYIKKWSDLNVQQSDITSILGSYYLTEESDPIFAAWRDSTNLSLWGNEVSVNGGSATNKMTLTNGTKTVTIEVDGNGLKIDGDVYATGGITAYGYGKDDQTVVTSFAQLTDIGGGSEGDVWGKTSNGYGWVKQSVGAIYSAGDYISISTANAISVNKNSLLSGYATESWVSSNFNKYELTKAAVEAVLTGNITSHTHSQYLTSDNISGMLTTSNYAATLDSVYAAKVHDHDSVYSKLGHTHTKSDITDFAHTHPFTEITGTAAFSQLPDMYWADVKVSNSSNAETAPKFKQITIDGITLSVVDGNLKINNATNNANVYATGGVSAYGLGLDNLTPVTSFAQLNEVLNTTPTEGQVWGKTENGYGWLNQSTFNPTQQQIRELVGDYVSTFGGKIGDITLLGGQTTYGTVNLEMSGNQLKASIVGLGSAAYKSAQDFMLAKDINDYVDKEYAKDTYLNIDDAKKTYVTKVYQEQDDTDDDYDKIKYKLGNGNVGGGFTPHYAVDASYIRIDNDDYGYIAFAYNDSCFTPDSTSLAVFGTNSDGDLAISNVSTSNITVGKANKLSGTDAHTFFGQIFWQFGTPSSVTSGEMTGVTMIDKLLHFDTQNKLIKVGKTDFSGVEGGQITLLTSPAYNDIQIDAYENKLRIFKDMADGLQFDTETLETYLPGDVRIKNVLIKYDADKHLLSFEDNTGALLNIASTGGITAYGIDGAEIGSLVNLNVSNAITTSKLYITPNSDNEISLGLFKIPGGDDYAEVLNLYGTKVVCSDDFEASIITSSDITTDSITINATDTSNGSAIITDAYVKTDNDKTYLYLKINNVQRKILLS